MVGKPNQKIPHALLQPSPAFEEPFSRVLIDCVGPLPKSKLKCIYSLLCALLQDFPKLYLRETLRPKLLSMLSLSLLLWLV